MKKLKKFIKRNLKKLLICVFALVILAIGLMIFSNFGVTTVKRVKKVLSPDFYSVECLDANCNYIVASKGDKLGKYTTYVYDSNGKKMAKVKEKFNSSSKYTRTISSVTKNYIIFKRADYASGKALGYTIATNKGKEKYTSENVLYSLTDYLISEKTDNNYKIIDNKGKKIFDNVSDIEEYADNNILSLKIKNENVITDAKGNSILNGYRIVSEVKDKNDNTLFFVLEDSNKNAYYFYSYAKNKIIGDSFNGYTTGSNEGELIITRNENGSSKRFTLDRNGKQKALSTESTKELIDSIKDNLNDDLSLYTDSVKADNQKVVIVNNKKDNSVGTYNIKTKKYSKLLDFSEENGTATIYDLVSNDKDVYLQINCSSSYCKKSTMIVYDMVNDKELYKLQDENNIPQNYTEYADGYKVIKYSLSSSDDYKGKYVLYNDKNKELLKSDNQIVIVDKKMIFGKTPSNQSLILFSAKKNKVLNSENNLGAKITIGDTSVYKYSDDNKTYLLNSNGKKLKELGNSSASLIYSKDAIIYIEGGRVNIINPAKNRTRTYKLKTNEKINNNAGENIAPYKNAIYVNNTIDNYVKVVNVNGRTVKKIKKVSLNSVKYNKKTDTVIIITRRVKNNNNLYGLYIAK